MQGLSFYHDRVMRILSGPLITSAALLLCRLALAGVFWRAGRTKIAEGTWLTISDSTRFLFEHEYTGVPLPTQLSMYMATYAEHALPMLLVLGLATRLSALALFIMTLTIQFFVYPDAWWTVHSLWAAMSLVLVSAGGGWLSLDTVLHRIHHGAKSQP